MESRRQRAICPDCEMKYWEDVKEGKYKKLFNISKDLYEKSYFLRNVRSYYERFGKLSEKQISAFKKTVKKLGE